MRLNESSRAMVCGNIYLIEYCQNAGISMEKLRECNIEKMGDTYVFVLPKINAPKSKLLIPLDVDLATQPDVVLTMEIIDFDNVNIETTDKTKRLLCI